MCVCVCVCVCVCFLGRREGGDERSVSRCPGTSWSRSGWETPSGGPAVSAEIPVSASRSLKHCYDRLRFKKTPDCLVETPYIRFLWLPSQMTTDWGP